MKKDLTSILDECLSRLKEGEPLEECLAHYPQEGAEIAPLLEMALALGTLKETEPPSPTALAAGRQRFLEEAARRRQAEARSWSRRAQEMGRQLRDLLQRGMRGGPALGRLATATLTALLLCALVGGGAVVASAHSLPGDPLYSVKRTAEHVQLLLAFHPSTKASLHIQFQERRQAEVEAVVAQGRQVEVELPGRIQSLSETVWRIGGHRVILRADTVVEGEPTVGLMAEVDALVQPDGSLLARRIMVEPPRPSAPLQTTATPTPTATPMPTATPRPTATPSPTASPTPTIIVTPTRTQPPPPSPTSTPKPTATMTARATATATPTDTPTTTPSPTSTPTPTATATPTATPQPPRPVKVKFEGLVEAIEESHWVVAGQKVLLNEDTVIEHSELAEVGAWAVVQARRQSDGSLLAQHITITRGADKPPKPVEFKGVVESISEAAWVVAGRTVLITEETVIEGTPRVGVVARVHALQQSDGTLLATRIVIEERIVEFEGPIQEIGADAWVIAGHRVAVDANTAIEGMPQVGALAEVRAIERVDGSLLATRIEIREPEPTATPEPTETPTETPEPTATLTPMATPSPIETSEPTSTPQVTGTLEPTATLSSTETPTETAEPTSAEPTVTLEGTGTPAVKRDA